MKHSYLLKMVVTFCMVAAMMMPTQAFAQDKNLIKADETLQKAVTTTNGTEKRELIDKAIELYTKAGKSKEEMFTIIGDALVNARDYTGATTYYTRGGTDAKKNGARTMGAEYIENAGEDAKNETKLLKKAVDSYTKGGAPKDGYKAVGDYYMAKGGPENTALALDNYALAGADGEITRIADDLYAQGPSKYAEAAAAYEKTGTPAGTKRAGEIYWSIQDYEKAYAAYDKGHDMDGIKKYADRLFDQGQTDAANAQYNKIADYYVANKNSEGLNKLAIAAFEGANYTLASMYYEKMADTKNMERAQSFDALYKFDFAGAIDHFEKAEDPAMANAIRSNLKTLEALRPIADEFDQIKQNEPYVGMDSNAVLGKKVANPQDQANFSSYYKAYQSSVVDKVFQVSASYAKLTDMTLKKVVKQKFNKYGAVRNILNADTYTKKKEKAAVKVADIYM